MPPRTDRQHLLECLARNLLHCRTVAGRQQFLAAWEKNHGAESVEQLKTVLTSEHARIQALDEHEREKERRRIVELSMGKLYGEVA